MKAYPAFLILATVLGAACAAPDTQPESVSDERPIDYSDPDYDPEACGMKCGATWTSCTTSTCARGKCATSTSTGGQVCCTGCVDAYGWCRSGTFAQACGANGAACAACPMGETCPSGACVTNCVEPASPCMVDGVSGTWGNGANGACICCTGCWTVDGTCVSGDYSASQCGHGGEYCQNCGSPPYATTACAGGVCAITSCSSGHSNCNSIVTDGCETPSSSCP